jgi:hypothetical protein
MILQGNASGGERARNSGKQANDLVDFAWAYIAKKSVLPDHPASGRCFSFLFFLAFCYFTYKSYI